MSKAITTSNDKMKNLRSLLEGSKSRIADVLPKHMSAERMVKIALVGSYKNPLLLECSPQSLLTALMQASELGLEPFTGLQQAIIVPHKNFKTNTYEAQFWPQYRGLVDIAKRSDEIASLSAYCVYERDTFECELGQTPKLRHIPCYDAERGKIILAYAIAQFKNGFSQFEVMTIGELEAVRKCSKMSGSGPWTQWTSEMYRKTVLKRICKHLPQSVQLAKAISLDNHAEGHEDVFDVDTVDIDSLMADEKQISAAEDLADKLAK